VGSTPTAPTKIRTVTPLGYNGAMTTQNYINHIALVLDESGSMSGLSDKVVKVADNLISYLAQRSKELDQETRVSVYTFNNTIKCIIFDKDVLRLPSLRGKYRPTGQTALIDALLKSQEDLADTSELYGDHAFLTYVITDGMENASRRFSPADVSLKIKMLPEHWTVACLVPNQQGVFEAKKFGFPSNNIAIWDATVQGLDVAETVIRTATENFMQARSTGTFRGTKGLFDMSSATLNKDTVKSVLKELKNGEYFIFEVFEGSPEQISDFVTRCGLQYIPGMAYYQLMKSETIQSYKKVAIVEKSTGKCYSGQNARDLLGLPNYDIRVRPQDNPDYYVFIQSTSVNRKLKPNTKLLVLK